MNCPRCRQAGITLFELTVVLVVLTFLSTAALSFSSLMERGTAKKLVGEMEAIKNNLYIYRERYGDVPGDDPRATQHLTGATDSYFTSSPGYGGDGLISGAWKNPYIGRFDESGLFWSHLALAGLVADPTSSLRYNAVRGYIGITSDNTLPTRPAGVPGLYSVCSAMIGGKLARMMDLEMDDGVGTTGAVWAAAETNAKPVLVATPATNYDDGKTYTVCMAF